MTNRAKRILIVDDDENIHMLIKKLLGSHTYEFESAYSLNEGAEKIKSFYPTIILLDINIGSESGFDLLKSLGHSTKVSTIMMSADSYNKNVRRAITLGASDFLLKPIVNKVLIQKIKKAYLKLGNISESVSLIEADTELWQCQCEAYIGALDNKTSVMISDSILDLKESFFYKGNSLNRLGGARKLDSGFVKTILTTLHDDRDSIDDHASELTEKQVKLLEESDLRIYALDDDPNFLEVVKLFCRKYSIKVKTFNKIVDFVDTLGGASRMPALCLIDLSVESENDSFELIESLKEQYENLPLVATTSNTDGESSLHAIELGADDFIYKPIKQNLLIHKILTQVQKDQLSSIYHSHPVERQKMLKIKVPLNITVHRIDETGIYLRTNSQLQRGSSIIVRSIMLDREFIVRIVKSRHEKDADSYYSYGEFQNIDISDSNKLMDFFRQ